MVVTLKTGQLSDLLVRLRIMPGAEKICGEITSKLENVLFDFDFIVDSWPDVKAVVSRSNPATAKIKYVEDEVNVFTTDPDALKSLLQNPNVLNWSQKIVLCGVNSETVPVVVALIQELNLSYHVNDPCVFLKPKKEKLKLRPIPDGFRLSSLQQDQSDLVNSQWKFSSGDVSNAYIRYLIETRPSCGLYNGEGELVGYALTYHYGSLGMLYVMEEHRGKGYAKVIISHLTETCLKEGIDVFVIIEADNSASVKLHQDVGFDIIPNLRCQFIYSNTGSISVHD